MIATQQDIKCDASYLFCTASHETLPAYNDEDAAVLCDDGKEEAQVSEAASSSSGIALPQHLLCTFSSTQDPTLASELHYKGFVSYVNVPLDTPKTTKGKASNEDSSACPEELLSRGLTQTQWSATVSLAAQTKRKSDRSKILLWTGMSFALGPTGYLLAQGRHCGNTTLRRKMADAIGPVNADCAREEVRVRFAWIDGGLRAYYQ